MNFIARAVRTLTLTSYVITALFIDKLFEVTFRHFPPRFPNNIRSDRRIFIQPKVYVTLVTPAPIPSA